MKENRISIIIPVYNAGEYFDECLKCLANQTSTSFEVIFVDDGSSDSSGQMCDAYCLAHNNAKVIHQNNMGPIVARYNGLKEALYDYILFIDADDFFEPAMIAVYLQYINHYQPDILISGYNAWYIDGRFEKKKFDMPEGLYSREKIDDVIVPRLIWNFDTDDLGIQPALWIKVFKKDLAVKVFNKLDNVNFHFGEDRVISWLSLLVCNNMFYLQQRLYSWRLYKYIPSYIQDDLYYSKVLEMFNILFENIKNLGYKEQLFKQLCFMYSDAVTLKNRITYRSDVKKINCTTYLFPYNKIRNGSNIIIYGGGKVGNCYMTQLQSLKYCNVIAWVDKNWEELHTKNKNIKPVSEIETFDFDYIVVAIKNRKVAAQVFETLRNMHIPEEKMINDVIEVKNA